MTPRLQTVLPTALLSLAALAGLAPPAAPQAVVETLLFAQDIKARLETLDEDLDALDLDFAGDLQALTDALVASTASPAETHRQLFLRVDTLDADVAAALASFTDGLQADASSHLQEMLAFPNAFAVGDGGLIDLARAKALKLRVRSTIGNWKRVHKLAKLLQKGFAYDLVFDRRGQALAPVTPSDDALATAAEAAIPLRIDVLMSGSTKGAGDDGSLCVAGTADPDAAAQVHVAIALPGGDSFELDVDVDAASGRWSASFPTALPGTLPEGNWQVNVTQAGVTLSDSLAVQ